MELVNALAARAVVHEPETRKNILSAMMPREMINRFPHAYDDHTYVFDMMEACPGHLGGMEGISANRGETHGQPSAGRAPTARRFPGKQ
jgi:hypothetical protein